jgi:hypothetical protein
VKETAKDQKKKARKPQDGSFARFSNSVNGTVLRSLKMAQPAIYESLTSPLVLLQELKSLGPAALAWKPETLFTALDQKYSAWTGERAGQALEKFHATGLLDTNVPPLVRNKILALRVILTSDTVHREWNVFEKVGGAFNDRIPNFGVLEPLSPPECASTVAMLDVIRPDEFANEVKAYIAACCHTDGMYTVTPSKYLRMAEPNLAAMNREETGVATDPEVTASIATELNAIKLYATTIQMREDFAFIQALKIFSADLYAMDALANNG